MDKKISGSRNCRNGAISGSRNRRKGRQILYESCRNHSFRKKKIRHVFYAKLGKIINSAWGDRINPHPYLDDVIYD